MASQVEVRFLSPVYTMRYLNPAERAKATVVRGPYDRVSWIGLYLVGANGPQGPNETPAARLCERTNTYGGSMRGNVECFKVYGPEEDDDKYFESMEVTAVVPPEPERTTTDRDCDPDIYGY